MAGVCFKAHGEWRLSSLLFYDWLELMVCLAAVTVVVFIHCAQTFLTNFEPLLSKCKTHQTGAFADSCVDHCQTVASVYWDRYIVGGQRIRETFADWYFSKPGGSGCEIDCAYPCNHNCSVPYGQYHSPNNDQYQVYGHERNWVVFA